MSSNGFTVFRGLEQIPPDFGPSALTIGNFDGVHAGHREILRQVVKTARDHGWKAAALTFDPHPLQVVAPDRAPKPDVDAGGACPRLCARRGHRLPGDSSFSRDVSPRWRRKLFLRDVVAAKLQARAILVGKDFRFGHKHAGNTDLLAAMGPDLGFETTLVPPILLRGQRVSSSLVRDLIEQQYVTERSAAEKN